ncbi:MAG: Holliday junction resolvase RuvX [Oscillospiraceae bacterium]|jgi:putative Holliday junction resolvase|nr:Holliday junction resolvase RuvX [Oscillospiraceae bacterium]
MAVDYGDARTGIAVSDRTATIAGDAWVVRERNVKTLADTILAEAAAREVSVIVLGHPINMDGTAGVRAEKSEALAELLRARGADVKLWDERRTTIAAHDILSASNYHGQKRKDTVDAVAATLILEGYLRKLALERE